METKKKVMFSTACFLTITLLTMATSQAVVIDDRAGSNVYWGGKYVNIKPSAYGDAIGRRSEVDLVEVTMNNDVMTVKITGPYFFNYVHNLKRSQDAPPGDLYISSQGWKVSGTPPYTKDIFEASEGWDYVISFQNRKVYALKFSDIIMTSALPHGNKYRAHQAWRGGYGQTLDDAAVTLTDSGLTFIFSVRNMRLKSEIGLHWTMKCGNDIVEGSALIPSIALAPLAEPVAAGGADTDSIDALAGDAAAPVPGAVPVLPATVSSTFPSAAGGGGFSSVGPLLAGGAIPAAHFGSHDDNGSVTPGSGPGRPVVPVEHRLGPEGPSSVPEPSTVLLLLASLSCMLARKRLTKRVARTS